MDETEIIELLGDAGAVKHPAWPAFVRQMEHRLYGRDPLRRAWHFFKRGWDEEAADVALGES